MLSDARVVIFLLIRKLGNVLAAQSNGFKAESGDPCPLAMRMAPLEGLRGLISCVVTWCPKLRVRTTLGKRRV